VAYSVRILADSLAPCGKRLTTFEVTYPRFVHSELMTHRQLSRNSASSRAIPIQRMIRATIADPAHPIHWGANQAGMQARAELTGWRLRVARALWFGARWFAVLVAWLLWRVGLHKQIANRLLEPWMWITVIVSATEWSNFFALRDHPDAQPEIALLAWRMRCAYTESQPVRLRAGEWHLPFVDEMEAHRIRSLSLDPRTVSVGRVARVSFLTHDGRRDFHEDVKLHDRLRGALPPHMSPFEHVAMALRTPEQSGNFIGFRQYRKEIPNECARELEGITA
jgi:hypothetical protein